MIADDRDHPLEWLVKLVTLPMWGPCYLAGVGTLKVWKALQRRKPKQDPQAEIMQPVLMPRTEVERACCRPDLHANSRHCGSPARHARLRCRQVLQGPSPIAGGGSFWEQACLEQEQNAYDQMQATWEKLTDSQHHQCVQQASVLGGSYFWLNACVVQELQSEQAVKKFEFRK